MSTKFASKYNVGIGVVIDTPTTPSVDTVSFSNGVATLRGRPAPFVNTFRIWSGSVNVTLEVNDLKAGLLVPAVSKVVVYQNAADKIVKSSKIPFEQVIVNPTPTPTPNPTPSSDGVARVISLINQFRATPAAVAKAHKVDLNEGLPAGTLVDGARTPVVADAALQRAAQKHADWMAANGVISHTGENGSSPSSRVAAEGYKGSVGENAGLNAGTGISPATLNYQIDDINDGFITDLDVPGRGHRINMLNAAWRKVGVGLAFGKYQNYAAFYLVLDFGT